MSKLSRTLAESNPTPSRSEASCAGSCLYMSSLCLWKDIRCMMRLWSCQERETECPYDGGWGVGTLGYTSWSRTRLLGHRVWEKNWRRIYLLEGRVEKVRAARLTQNVSWSSRILHTLRCHLWREFASPGTDKRRGVSQRGEKASSPSRSTAEAVARLALGKQENYVSEGQDVAGKTVHIFKYKTH